MFRGDLNVEQAREVFHGAHESLFTMIDQLHMGHICMQECEDILTVTARWLIFVCVCVDFVYVVWETWMSLDLQGVKYLYHISF